MVSEWLGDHWIQALGTVLSGGAVFFAWRNWDRTRRIVTIQIQPLREEKKGHGELRKMQLTLPVVFRARRGDVFLQDTFLVVGKERVRGEHPAGESAARPGDKTFRYWALTDVRHLPPKEPWKVCWLDSEDRLHCPRSAHVDRDDVRRLTTEKTRAERAGDVANLGA